MSISSRISELINALEKGKKNEFARKIGIPSTTLSGIVGPRQSDPSGKILSCVLEKYSTVNARWLLTGQGEMFMDEISTALAEPKTEYNNDKLGDILPCPLCRLKDDIIDKQTRMLDRQEKEIERLTRYTPADDANSGKRNSA